MTQRASAGALVRLVVGLVDLAAHQLELLQVDEAEIAGEQVLLAQPLETLGLPGRALALTLPEFELGLQVGFDLVTVHLSTGVTEPSGSKGQKNHGGRGDQNPPGNGRHGASRYSSVCLT